MLDLDTNGQLTVNLDCHEKKYTPLTVEVELTLLVAYWKQAVTFSPLTQGYSKFVVTFTIQDNYLSFLCSVSL